MAEIITMPRLSDTMEEGTVSQWLKKVGDSVKEGDILAEIETDKATMEFESFYEGKLLHIGIEEGQSAPIDALLAIIGEEGEDVSSLLNTEKETVPKEESKPAMADTVKPVENTAEKPEMPENVHVITMPRLSDTMEEGTVAAWLKKEGDVVNEGDILAEIETDKATMEFESFYSGTLLHIGIQESESATVDSVLAVIGEKGGDVKTAIAAFEANAGESPEKEAVQEAVKETPKAVQQEAKPIATAVQPSNLAASTNGRVIASPLAKKLATEKGINLHHVQGSGEKRENY